MEDVYRMGRDGWFMKKHAGEGSNEMNKKIKEIIETNGDILLEK